MKVVVTGASGLLGRAVLVGTAYTRAKNGLVKLDLVNQGELESFIDEQKPDAIVHCAAERRPDVAQNDQEGTRNLNIQVPRRLGALCKEKNVMLIYISSDYVFDGTCPPYHVTDKPNPLNFYGETKLGGEQAIQEVNPDAVILRVPILYGEVEYNGESAINILVDAVQSKTKTLMDNVASRYPTNVQDIGRVIKDLLVNKIDLGQDIKGIFHFSGTECFTKYTICQLFGSLLNLPIDHLERQDEIPASAAVSRPKDAHLSNKRLEDLGIDTKSTPFVDWWTEYLSK
ncbi:hypothetical protein CLU79DRAFT_880062 [Phycomyces nitens]|nr:hypothetical protein CLU79DRAFT_880062 [Phycomyces nitens]